MIGDGEETQDTSRSPRTFIGNEGPEVTDAQETRISAIDEPVQQLAITASNTEAKTTRVQDTPVSEDECSTTLASTQEEILDPQIQGLFDRNVAAEPKSPPAAVTPRDDSTMVSSITMGPEINRNVHLYPALPPASEGLQTLQDRISDKLSGDIGGGGARAAGADQMSAIEGHSQSAASSKNVPSTVVEHGGSEAEELIRSAFEELDRERARRQELEAELAALRGRRMDGTGIDEEHMAIDDVENRRYVTTTSATADAAAVKQPVEGTFDPQQGIQQTPHPTSQPSHPGAFAQTPGGTPSERRQTPSFTQVIGTSRDEAANSTRPTESIYPNSVTTAATTDQNQGLVQADEVQDDPDVESVQQASPVDVSKLEQKGDQERRAQRLRFYLLGCGLLLCAFAILAVGLGVGLSARQNDSNKETKTTHSPSNSQSMIPSEAPSPAPTGALDLLLMDLPEETIARLNSGSDMPQWKAWNWLSNHQNLTHLPEWRKKQLFALACFYYSFDGESWPWYLQERWMDDEVDECSWFSSGAGYITDAGDYKGWEDCDFWCREVQNPCNDEGAFVLLMLWNVGLEGISPVVPPEISLLQSLSILALAWNRISVPLSSIFPTDIFQLSNMTLIELQLNQFSGMIPSEIGKWTALTHLDLYSNQLTGQIPTELGLLTQLEYLSLGDNHLSGGIPSQLGRLSALPTLDLLTNDITGSLPTEMGQMTAMRDLHLSENSISGLVPSELGLLANISTLWLQHNSLSGAVPSELGLLSLLTELWLSDNLLSHTIPTELSNQVDLRLDGNTFTGIVPSHLCSVLSCDCSANVSIVSTCAELQIVPGWPGRFPPAGQDEDADSIVLNILSNPWPFLNDWLWQKQNYNETGVWETLQGSEGGLGRKVFLSSFTLPLEPNARYRLTVSNSEGHGIWSGWTTLTGANQTVLYSYVGGGTRIEASEEQVLASHGGSFSQITVEVEVSADGSVLGIESHLQP